MFEIAQGRQITPPADCASQGVPGTRAAARGGAARDRVVIGRAAARAAAPRHRSAREPRLEPGGGFGQLDSARRAQVPMEGTIHGDTSYYEQ